MADFENSSHIPERERRVYDVEDLVRRVQQGEMPNMTGDELDALDEAIELGLVKEEALRVQRGIDAA